MDYAGIKFIVFDWGGTLMTDQPLPGPMVEWKSVQAIPGAVETLRELAARGYQLEVGTNANASTPEQIFMALGRVGLAEFIDECYTPDVTGGRKPEKRFYDFILKDLGAKPSECLMVGDSFTNDVLGAVGAGWRAVWFNPGSPGSPGSGEKKTGERHETIFRFQELLSHLRDLKV